MGRGVGSRGKSQARGVTTYVAWTLLFTSPLLVWSLLRARVRRWLLRTALSILLPILKYAARLVGLASSRDMDPHARTIEDPVRPKPAPTQLTHAFIPPSAILSRETRPATCAPVAPAPRVTPHADEDVTPHPRAHPTGPAGVARGSELARGRGEARGQGTLGVVARRPLLPPRQRREAPHTTDTQTSRRATEDTSAVRGPRRRIARALGRGRRGAIQRGDPGYRARAPGPTGTAVRHHHTPRHGGGARLFGDELSRFCSRPSTRSTCARFRASRSWCWSGGSSRRW